MKTILEINGHKYDAKTGELLMDEPKNQSLKPTSAPTSQKPAVGSGVVLDGINRHASSVPTKIDPIPGTQNTVKQLTNLTDLTTPNNQHLSNVVKPAHRTTDKSNTLLRTAVKKPLANSSIHSTSGHTHAVNQASGESVKHNFSSIPAHRAQAAKQTSLNPNVSKFGVVSSSITKVVNSLSVSPAPKNNDSASTAPPIVAKNQDKLDKPQVFNHRTVSINMHPPSRLPKEKLTRRISNRLSVSPKVLGICAGALVIIILTGFFAYQNIPSFAMRVAARGAGFSGHLPSNIPSGFSYKGPINYSKGVISLNYKSNTDDRQFTITQKPTSWTSDSLLTNYLIASKFRYQTYRDSGLTVFVYNEGNATWVDKGVWFSIAGEGTLSSDQILAIAGSL